MDQELIFIKSPPEQIVSIKFILESYEGLGIVRTLNAERGLLVIIAPSDSMQTLRELLFSLKQDLRVEEIEMPGDLSSDWLLKEYFGND